MGYKDPTAQREYQRLWMRRRRNKFFAGKVCVQCGATDRLELDHIDPAEKSTHNIWSWSAKRRATELAKCQVLCSDCHLEKTLEQRPKAQHGGLGMYKRGCRCDACVERNRARVRLQRARHSEMKVA